MRTGRRTLPTSSGRAITEVFATDKRTLNQYRRYTGRAAGLLISFEAHLLGSKVEFDQEAGTLMIKGVPTQLVDQLKRSVV